MRGPTSAQRAVPKRTRFRPAIDPLFRSAAYSFGRRVVGVILTGFLDDGTAGLWAVKQGGGTAIVQNPEEALAPSMPMSALKHVAVDHCLPLHRIASLLVELSETPASPEPVNPLPKNIQIEVKIAREDNAIASGIVELGQPSLFACPECHGVLLQIAEGKSIRFRCHTGHAFSLETLLNEINESTEKSLWNAIRSFEEAMLLLRRMSALLRQHQHSKAADALDARAGDEQARSELIRAIVLHHNKPAAAELPNPVSQKQNGE